MLLDFATKSDGESISINDEDNEDSVVDTVKITPTAALGGIDADKRFLKSKVENIYTHNSSMQNYERFHRKEKS